MTRRLVIAVASGMVWGVVATAIHLAMFRGLLWGGQGSAPAESALPIAVLLYLVRAPFIAAIYVSTFVLGRGSPTLVELVIEAIVFGGIGGTVGTAVWRRARRP